MDSLGKDETVDKIPGWAPDSVSQWRLRDSIGPPHSVNNFVSLEICFIHDCFLEEGYMLQPWLFCPVFLDLEAMEARMV